MMISLIFTCFFMISTILPNLNEGKQLVIVILENRDINTGQLYKFEKLEGRWNQIGPAHLIAVGANGIAWAKSEWAPERAVLKKEGDKRSPAGIFPLTQTFGRVSVKKAKYLAMPYEEIGPNAQCIEDKKSKYYNQIVFDNTKVNPDWEQDDRMLREDNLYDWGIFVEHNNLKTPGDGSCIFIHIWRSPGKPTAGCTAMSKKHLTQLMYWLDASKNPDLVLMTRQDYNRIRKIIDLPQID